MHGVRLMGGDLSTQVRTQNRMRRGGKARLAVAPCARYIKGDPNRKDIR